MTHVEHTAERPLWGCRACGLPWPCANAREGLLAEYRTFPSLLNVLLSSMMFEALDDYWLEGDVPPDLFDRFMAWARQIPEQQSPDQQIPDQQVPERQLPEQQLPEQQIPKRQLPEHQLPEQ
jgi:hypothetical protein